MARPFRLSPKKVNKVNFGKVGAQETRLASLQTTGRAHSFHPPVVWNPKKREKEVDICELETLTRASVNSEQMSI